LTGVPANATYTVLITTNPATVGAPPPAVALPNNWVTTGENRNGTIDGTPNSQQTIAVATSNISNVNFGIEQRPIAVGGTASPILNPGGTTGVPLPSNLFTGSTDSDGTVTKYRLTAFPSNATTLTITISGVSYTAATFPPAGITVSLLELNSIEIDPVDGAVTVEIPFVAIDNAGQESLNTSLARLPLKVISANPNLNSGFCSATPEMMFILDDSSSVDNAELQEQRNAVLATLDHFINNNIPARAAIVGFDGQKRTVIGYTDVTAANRSLFVNALNTNYGVTGSGTNWENGFQEALGVTPGTPDIVFFFTDGELNQGGSPNDEADNFRAVGAHIYGIAVQDPALTIDDFKGITDGNDTTEFTGNNAATADYVRSNSYADLAGKMTQLVQNICPPSPKTPKLLLVKRITAINEHTTNNPYENTVFFNQFVNGGTNNDDDNHPNWPAPNTYLVGAIDAGLVKPNDEVEYTIYFLNTDAASKNVKICDLVPDGQTFVPDAYNAAVPHPTEVGALPADTGIALGFSNTGLPTVPTFYLTNIQDTATGDRGRFYPAGDPNTPATCKKFDSSGNVTTTGVAANTSGAVVVEIVKGTDTIPASTGAGNPTDSYGFIRFRAKVN
jgi:uncharacterized repeat protein (TIGR01451 family)